MREAEFSDLSRRVIGCAIEVHHVLGPGLLESIYKKCLAREMELKGIRFAKEVDVSVHYKGLNFEHAYQPIFWSRTGSYSRSKQCTNSLSCISRSC